MLALGGAIGLLFMVMIALTLQTHQQHVDQRLHRNLAGYLATDDLISAESKVDRRALSSMLDRLMALNPAIEVYLLDPNGKILEYSAPPGRVQRERVSLAPLQRLLRGDELPILGDDPRDPGGEKIFSAAPITHRGRTAGYLYVVLGGQNYDSIASVLQDRYVMRLGLSAAFGGVLLTLLFGIAIVMYLTRRMGHLNAAMQAFQDGSEAARVALPARVSKDSGDEIDRLGLAFNAMAERMVAQVHELKQADGLRRELVANVSHDLRTPLAALRGYLETVLLKGESLSPEEQRNYLEIAARQSEWLGKLVTELFEFAKLDSREAQLNRESFSLAELAQDVTQKFSLAAGRKNIAIAAQFNDGLPLVFADIALVERVFENLIENALRYTPEAGRITVALTRGEGQVQVCITDTGPGIPKEEVPYIFERFYRVEKHRTNPTSNAGLGLGIARRIVELHGGQIRVESEPGHGTTFSFGVPTESAALYR
ncbi:MAG: ATP-binding protein [Burkholderiales bacterium]